ncbi:hypothetical protein NQ318_008526 [Aromia moschata]|uniref:Gfo/Idh/MocA-like oxidoreductase N-terminal domain-containing protein n=1 Tax=Aromia moschata TaxID=1265417 RepID=A0AAV8XNM6_9CUCU|nr:hypothetical protein NQ318_008526 [Aromia moschata]
MLEDLIHPLIIEIAEAHPDEFREDIVFQQDGAPLHYTRPTLQYAGVTSDIHLEDLRFNGTADKENFGVAIFGIGRAGTIHLANLVVNRKVRILYIVDDDKQKLAKHTSLPALINPSVRFIVCSSPTITHEKIIMEALHHRKAIFCEKPIAENIEKSKS